MENHRTFCCTPTGQSSTFDTSERVGNYATHCLTLVSLFCRIMSQWLYRFSLINLCVYWDYSLESYCYAYKISNAPQVCCLSASLGGLLSLLFNINWCANIVH